MNSDELKRFKKIEKQKELILYIMSFLENSRVWVFKESEAIEFAKYLIKNHAIFKFYKRIQFIQAILGCGSHIKRKLFGYCS